MRQHPVLSLLLGIFLCFLTSAYTMENAYQSTWFILPKEVRAKIFACADINTKEKLYFSCPNIFATNINNILKHSPLLLPRQCHTYHMVHTAKNNDVETFVNLLHNAHNCDHNDIYKTIKDFFMYFLPEEADELTLLSLYNKYHDPAVLNQVLPSILAIYSGDNDTIDQYLIKNMTYPENHRFMNPLFIAACYNHPLSIAELFLSQNKNLLNMSSDDWTPLFGAVCGENIDMCKFLLSFNDIEIDKIDHDGMTPLTIAIQNRSTDILDLLIDHAVTHNVTEKILQQKDVPASDTTWYYAARLGYVDILKKLLTPVNFRVPHIKKPLHRATQSNRLDAVRMLLLSHSTADINAQDEASYTALCIAAADNFIHIAQTLLEYKADVNCITDNHETPLWFAAYSGYIDMVILLLAYNADPHIASHDGVTPLHVALLHNHTSIARILIEHNANPNAVSEKFDHISPLTLAITKNNHAACEMLLQNGADPNLSSAYEFNPLTLAIVSGKLAMVTLLLAYGANINHRSTMGETPLSIALINKDEYMIRLLLQQPDLIINEEEEKLLKTL
jgi:ankyrin repeat protein